MAQRVQAFDWSLTPLGPMDRWPTSLRVAVDICLSSRFPMFVWWGSDRINIYNDAYVPMLGKRHPAALGRPARESWADIWHVVGPQADAVFDRGEATWNERMRLDMERNGFLEETYFTWSYSPIRDESGQVGGLFCAVTEDTPRVMAERAALASEERARTILESITDAFFALDSDWRFTYVNREAQRALSREYDELVGKSLWEEYPGLRGTEFEKVYLKAMTQRQAGTVTAYLPEHDRWYEVHAYPSASGGGVSVYFRDVSDQQRGMATLVETRRRLDAALLAGEVGTFEWEVTTDRLWGDRNFERIFGIKLDASGTAPLVQYMAALHPDDRAPVMDRIMRTVETGCDYQAEYRIGTGEGTRWVVARGTGERDASGRVVRFPGVVVDITDRRRAEEAVRESERRLQIAQAAASVGTWELDIATGATVWSEGVWDLLRLAPGEARASLELWAAHVHPEDRDEVLRNFDEVLASRRPDFYFEFRVVRSDGQIRWVFSKGQVVYDAAGTPIRAVGANQDITERRTAEDAVRQHERQMRLVADTAPVFIAYCDRELRFLFVNRHYAERLGRSQEELIGRTIPEVRGKQAYELIRPYVEQVLSGQLVEFETEVPYEALGNRWMQCRYAPDHDERGEVRGWVSVIIDVTSRRQAEEALRRSKEEAERASAAKSEFLATLSHELRTPLTPVMLTVSLLEHHPALASELRDDVATIRRNVELESRLISDLLDLTRIENGKLQLDEQDVDVHLVIRSAIDICQREASAHLITELRASSHMVRGDSTRLQQVFWNLINNAIKFTGERGTITVRSSGAEGGRIRVEVTDTGVGIDPAVVPRLFTAFEQGEVRAARQQAGLGLGLSISRRLVEMHGGTITASSAGRGSGATFAVELPTVNSFAVPPVAQPPRRFATVSPLRVLLVEDHEPTVNVMTRLLRSAGHHVTGVSTAASAVAAARQGGFDVLICDLGLPDGSGLDVMRQVRGTFEGRAIALTGYGMEGDIAASKAAGFTDHLTKPVDLAALETAIARLNVGSKS